RVGARSGEQPGAVSGGGGGAGSAVRPLLWTRRGYSPRHVGARVPGAFSTALRAAFPQERRGVCGGGVDCAGAGAGCNREGALMQPVIAVRDLRYRYEDGTAALNGVDFDLEAGESVALLGANGSGKTTFALHLNGLLSGEGSVEVCGLPMNKRHAAEIRRKIGLVFQDSDCQLFMPTVIEDVTFGPLNH